MITPLLHQKGHQITAVIFTYYYFIYSSLLFLYLLYFSFVSKVLFMIIVFDYNLNYLVPYGSVLAVSALVLTADCNLTLFKS